MASRPAVQSISISPDGEEMGVARWGVQAGACFGASLLYAATRYHLLGDVPWSYLPLFTVNKAVSFTAVVLLAGSYVTGSKRLAVRFGLLGFTLAVLHSIFSMVLLGPADYPKLYDGNRLNLPGQFSMLFGCLCLLAFALPATASIPSVSQSLDRLTWKRWQRVGYAGLLLIALHVFAMGFQGWLTPASWPGWLPPITGLSFLVAVWPLVWQVRRCRRHRTRLTGLNPRRINMP